MAALRGTLQTSPAGRLRSIARWMQAWVVSLSFGVSRITTTCRTLRGSRCHARVKPLTCARKGSWPCGMTQVAPVSWTTNTMLISGCWRNQRGSVLFHLMQLPWSGLRSFLTVRENGQPERVIDSPRQWCWRATTSSAARQWDAWLSPTSAIVPFACFGATPNAHTFIGRLAIIVHGEFGRLRADTGVGMTRRRRPRLTHGCSGSRDAAPKQSCFWATKALLASVSALTWAWTYAVPQEQTATDSAVPSAAAVNVQRARWVLRNGPRRTGSSIASLVSHAASSVNMAIGSLPSGLISD